MRDERVVDASVVAAALFNEELAPPARRFLLERSRLIAPDHLFAEIASVAAKKVWLGETTQDVGAKACTAVREIVAATIPSQVLAPRAFELAALHRFSAYDGLYLALAELRRAAVYTFDQRLARKALEAGFGDFIESPSTE